MKKLLWVAGALILFVLAYAGMGFAEDRTGTEATQASNAGSATTSPGGESSGKDWKQELASDKEALKGVRDTVKSNSGAAKQEEQQLREQIKQARSSGDVETAKNLEAQLKSTHAENVQQKQQDLSAIKDARQEMRQDRREARQDRMGPPPPQGQGGVNQPPLPPQARGPAAHERREDKMERKEDRMERREDRMERREDRREYREDKMERKEDRGERREDKMERREERREGGQQGHQMGARGQGGPGAGGSPRGGGQGGGARGGGGRR